MRWTAVDIGFDVAAGGKVAVSQANIGRVCESPTASRLSPDAIRRWPQSQGLPTELSQIAGRHVIDPRASVRAQDRLWALVQQAAQAAQDWIVKAITG